MYVAVGAMLVAIAASVIVRPVLGAGGLALANAIGVTVEVMVLLIILRIRLRPSAQLTLHETAAASVQIES